MIELKKSQDLLIWNSKKMYYHSKKSHQRTWKLKRGEVYFVDLGENIGSEENKIRPCVVLQSNSYNFTSPVFTCAIISNSPKTLPDIQVPITGIYPYPDKGVNKNLSGTVDLGQILTIGKERIISKKICTLKEIGDIDISLLAFLGLKKEIEKRDNEIKSLKGKIEYLKNLK